MEPVDVDTAADVVGIRGQRILLAGAVAQYTLLAMVPLFVVLLVSLSHVVDEYRRLDTVASNLQPWTPRHLRGDP